MRLKQMLLQQHQTRQVQVDRVDEAQMRLKRLSRAEATSPQYDVDRVDEAQMRLKPSSDINDAILFLGG